MARKSNRSSREPAGPGGDPTHAPAAPAKKPRGAGSGPTRSCCWPPGALIFGAVFWSHFLSDLPDVTQLLVKGTTRDITILDDQGRLIARRGLTQGARVDVSRLPSYVPNAFIAIEDRRFRSHFGLDPIGLGARAHSKT